MKTLSEQLSEFSDRARKVDDVVGAAREKNRARLEAERAALTTSVTAAKTKATGKVEEAKAGMQTQWDTVRSSVEQRFAESRADADKRQNERDVRKAQHRAEVAEQDAVDAIDLALSVLDGAEYAIVDAAIARTDADDLAASRQ
ncbi:hypothetical protein [Frankia sp. Cas3]|uniref:hypothetical protein n=1 Tax=Frankia sp. Cas3 TaxID=3073926 RepID=UPI002AD3AB7E|nr:hypothetical protein [Frankia sp. Cas3]